MYRLNVTLADNVRGSTPITNLYRLITQQYPALGLTQANSKITLLIAHSDALNPNRAFLQVQRTTAPFQVHEFQYDRFNVGDLLVNPVFTALELPSKVALTNSVALLAALATKVNLNFTPADFWVDAASIEYAGGSVRPNWILKSRFDSIFWCGEFNLHLHL